MRPDLMPPKERPPIARRHCRHYDYKLGLGLGRGPRCAVGLDNHSKAGGALCCMPRDDKTPACPAREEWTEEERAATKAFSDGSVARALIIMAAIPTEGPVGVFQCPICDGRVAWSRARNGHIHASCSTRWCFSVIRWCFSVMQ